MKSLLSVLVIASAAGIVAGIGPGENSAASEASAAYRDGVYLAKLAVRRGGAPHVAVGRWSTAEDRSAFIAGYERSYSRLAGATADLPRDLANAAHRDGYYLGKRDARLGNSQHIAAGRWSQEEDRTAFAIGYRNGYNEVTSARAQEDKAVREAFLVR